MSELARLDAIMSLTLEERGALYTLAELAEARGGFVPDQERWLAGWLQCSVRKWRLIRAALLAKGNLESGLRGDEQGFVFVSAENQSRVTIGSREIRAEKIAETKTEVNENNEASRPREARGGDKPSTSENTCSGGGGVGGERASDPISSDDWPEGDHLRLLTDAAASPWLDPDKSLGLVTSAGRLEAWRRRGASWKRHVLPVVTTLAKANGEPISNWKFFEPAIGRAVKASRDELDLPDGVVTLRATGPPRSFDEKSSAAWDEAIKRLAEND